MEKKRQARERYANFIIPTLKDPYEIWLPTYKDGSARPNYIGLFDTESDGNILVIIKENKDGTILYNAFPVFDEDINDKRVGVLLYNKERDGNKNKTKK